MNAKSGYGSDPKTLDPEDELQSLKFAQQEVLTAPGMDEALPRLLPMRRMPLDSAVAPLLASPITPFARTERKKAHTSAVYYSECFLKGVTPKDADNAATDIKGRYNKWWVETGYHDDKGPPDGDTNKLEVEPEHSSGCSLASIDGDTTTEHSSLCKRAHYVSDSSEQPRHARSKRSRRRGGVRDMIQDHTVDPYEAVCHSVASVTMDGEPFCSNPPRPSDAFSIRSIPNLSNVGIPEIEALRDELVQELKDSGGDTETASFQSKLSILNSFYLSSENDARAVHGAYSLDGTWLTLSKPTYQNVKGQNDLGQYIYTLGGMSFDMFRPTSLVCSIQGTFNTISVIDPALEELPVFIPRSLRKEVHRSMRTDESQGLRTYNIVVAFTIEPNQTRTGRQVPAHKGNSKQDSEYVIRRPIRGIMTNYGYILPDPQVPNRVSIWFTGGALEVNDEEQDLEEWKRIFGEGTAPRRDMRELARLLAAKVLLGACASDNVAADGMMSYELKRPIGGHGSAFCDVLYMDNAVRIMRGHRGSLFVFSKVTSE